MSLTSFRIFVYAILPVLLGCDQRDPSNRFAESVSSQPIPSTSVAEDSTVNPSDSQFVTVEPSAAVLISQCIDKHPAGTNAFVRLEVFPGGCVGYYQTLSIDSVITTDDRVFETGDVRLVVLKRQAEMIRGTRIDAAVQNGEVGFKVENPNFEGDSREKWLAQLEQDAE